MALQIQNPKFPEDLELLRGSMVQKRDFRKPSRSVGAVGLWVRNPKTCKILLRNQPRSLRLHSTEIKRMTPLHVSLMCAWS